MDYTSFNSKVVRLEGVSKEQLIVTNTTFQFQGGAVRSIENNVEKQVVSVFQFQGGAVRSQSNTGEIAKELHVSIPRWCG